MMLETVTGKQVDPENPTPEQIDIEDIAWGLSRISRFCGHTITAVPYNVAQHSIFVAEKVAEYIDALNIDFPDRIKNKNKICLRALLHDASEVYTGDLPSPIKQIPTLRPIIKAIENKLMDAVYTKYDLMDEAPYDDDYIKRADKFAQRVEAHAFMPSRGIHWQGLPDVTLEEIQKFPAPLPSLDSYKLFMKKFNEYRSDKCN